MSFLGDFLSGGAKNNFKAEAPVNTYKADPNALGNYGQTIAGAQQAVGGINRQQGALTGQLANQAAGGGPNPALEQLHQTTAQNINNAASQVAGTRGINPALAARMAVDAGAGANQQAAGQAATMRAQQQIAAQQQLAGVLAGQQQANTALLGTAGGLQNQGVLGTEGINAGVAAGNQSANLAAQQINAGVQGQNAQATNGLLGGILQGGGAAASLFVARGGMIPSAAERAKATAQKVVKGKGPQKLAGGDEVQGGDAMSPLHLMLDNYARPAAAPANISPGRLQNPSAGPDMSQMNLSSPTLGINTPQDPAAIMRAGLSSQDPSKAGKAIGAGMQGLGQGLAQDQGANVLNRYMTQHLYGQTMSEGGPSGNVHGPEIVQGDSEKNDVVPALLSGGEHVTRKEVAEAPGVREVLEKLNNSSPDQASTFAQHLMRRQGSGYDKVVKARRMAEGGDTEAASSGGAGAKPSPDDAEKAKAGAEKINSMLPDWLSGHKAVVSKRKQLSDLDAQTRDE